MCSDLPPGAGLAQMGPDRSARQRGSRTVRALLTGALEPLPPGWSDGGLFGAPGGHRARWSVGVGCFPARVRGRWGEPGLKLLPAGKAATGAGPGRARQRGSLTGRAWCVGCDAARAPVARAGGREGAHMSSRWSLEGRGCWLARLWPPRPHRPTLPDREGAARREPQERPEGSGRIGVVPRTDAPVPPGSGGSGRRGRQAPGFPGAVPGAPAVQGAHPVRSRRRWGGALRGCEQPCRSARLTCVGVAQGCARWGCVMTGGTCRAVALRSVDVVGPDTEKARFRRARGPCRAVSVPGGAWAMFRSGARCCPTRGGHGREADNGSGGRCALPPRGNSSPWPVA